MTPEQIRLQCLSLVMTKASQDFDPAKVIEKAKAFASFVSSDTPQGPERRKGTLTIDADTATGPRKA